MQMILYKANIVLRAFYQEEYIKREESEGVNKQEEQKEGGDKSPLELAPGYIQAHEFRIYS